MDVNDLRSDQSGSLESEAADGESLRISEPEIPRQRSSTQKKAKQVKLSDQIKKPEHMSPRIKYLHDFYFSGTARNWANEQISFTTGTPWDVQYNELNYYIVPETYAFFQTFRAAYAQTARPVALPEWFWELSIPERRAVFNKEVMVTYLPQEILPGDLLAGARFNIHTSACLTRREQKQRDRGILGKRGLRAATFDFHNHGYGNCGPTSGHLVPGYDQILKYGFKQRTQDIETALNALSADEQKGEKGAQLRAMLTACSMPVELAAKYAEVLEQLAAEESGTERKKELVQMAKQLKKVPLEGAETFWEAMQALWLTHMLVMSDENYPGPGVSFGRIDQYLLPYWERSKKEGMSREFAKEIIKCFWIHANTAYDAMIRVGNQGITAGFGQLLTLSGMGPGGSDLTNELTYLFLEVIDEMSPILEPKPNIRLHRGSPEPLLDRIVAMISTSQGAPFLLNFDERSQAGMLLESEKEGLDNLIHRENVHDYASVGCLENTMVGNDRSGTVDCNSKLLKPVERVFTRGKDMHPFIDPITGKAEPIRQEGPDTGDPEKFSSFEEFWEAFCKQTAYCIEKIVSLYEWGESVRARFHPTPYLSTLVAGCLEKGMDITRGGAEIGFVTIEAIGFATAVDSLLAVKYLVFDKQLCTMKTLIKALQDNWKGHEVLQSHAKARAPKYGRDTEADAMALKVMEVWTEETWKYTTISTKRRFRPGMLSWNYWIGDGFILGASADGRPQGQFLANAICPSNGADTKGPTANANSVGKALGGKKENSGWDGYVNLLPNGASHTISFNPAMVKKEGNKEAFKAFLRGYCENGGTALQINMLDADTLKAAQENPEEYRNLLVRVTGYNAYFTSIGRELQDEIIARLSHNAI